MTSSKNPFFLLSLVLLATVLVYLNSLHNPFVSDDRAIILEKFQFRQSWAVEELFQSDLFGKSPLQGSYFRPLTLWTFAWNYRLAGENPAGYRAVNIALHLLAVFLAFLFFFRLADRRAALFGALVYALHPVHVQAVSYISSRSDLLYTILALASLLLWRKGNEARGAGRSLFFICALGGFFLGLFAKESIIVVPPLAVAMDLIWNPSGSWRDKIKENCGWYAGFLVLFAVYFFIRTGFGYPFSMEEGKKLAATLRALFALKLFALYLGVIFYPAHLSFFRVVPLPQSFFEWPVILGFFLLTGTLAAAWRWRKGRKEISFGLLWFAVSLLPVLNLSLLNAPMMEHWLYLPLIGLALAFVSGVRSVADAAGQMRRGALALILVALLLGARTISRNAEWSDHVALFSQEVSHYPGNWMAWTWLGDALRVRGMVHDAVRAYQTGLALNPKVINTWVALGDALSVVGRDDEAEEILHQATAARPSDPWFWYLLGMHRLKTGKYREALEPLKKSTELSLFPTGQHLLGSVYLRLGQEKKAEESFTRATALYPGRPEFHSGIHIGLGKFYLRQAKINEAEEEWRLALRFEPGNAEARDLLQKNTK